MQLLGLLLVAVGLSLASAAPSSQPCSCRAPLACCLVCALQKRCSSVLLFQFSLCLQLRRRSCRFFFIARLLPAILSCSVFFKPSYTTPFERSGHVARKNYGESLLGPRLFVCSFSFALTSPGSCLWSGCRRKRLLRS